jgi:hypothetical protein
MFFSLPEKVLLAAGIAAAVFGFWIRLIDLADAAVPQIYCSFYQRPSKDLAHRASQSLDWNGRSRSPI